MKKRTVYALMSAIALTGAIGFSGCSTSDDVLRNENGEEINPTYDPVAKTVKTDLTIALTSQLKDNKAGTRMLGDDVQASGFLGIKDIYLLPYKDDGTSNGQRIALGNNKITAAQLNAVTNSHNYHYIGVEVPTDTKTFLFYGVSDKGNSETLDDRFKYGVISPVLEGKTDPADIKFNLMPIYPTYETTNTDRDFLVKYLKDIAATTGWYNTTDATMLALYNSFTSLLSGSSASVRQTVKNLYSNIYGLTTAADPVGSLALAIIANICGTGANTYATEGLTSDETPVRTGVLTFTNAVPDNYPASINLPDGAAVIQWSNDTPKVPSVVSKNDAIVTNTNPMTSYVFPPSLYYYTNSGIRVANVVQDVNYSSKTDWTTILTGYGATSGVVTEATRDIALEKEIQYAVGRMELTVKPGSTTLKDRTGADIAISDGSFTVTGVFVGSQYSKGSNFVDNSGSEYLIYDKLATAISVPASTASTANHTLAMQTTENASIAIAVELVNNTGSDFEGFDGIISNGSKFYLTTTLNPSAGTGYGDGKKSVFIQDYVTKVNLTISANTDSSAEGVYPKGLGDARVTIPNLGTPALRLGFSVDLSWSDGLVFDNLEI